MEKSKNPPKRKRKPRGPAVPRKVSEAKEWEMRDALAEMARRASALWDISYKLESAINRDGSVDAQVIFSALHDEDGSKANEVMFGIDVKQLLEMPPETWISIGVSLSKRDDAAYERDVDRLLDTGMDEEEAKETIRTRYARFRGLDYIASYPQHEKRYEQRPDLSMAEKRRRVLVQNQLNARAILGNAIMNRGGYVRHIVYRLGWRPDLSRPAWMRTKD